MSTTETTATVTGMLESLVQMVTVHLETNGNGMLTTSMYIYLLVTALVAIASTILLFKKEKSAIAMDPTADFKPFKLINKENVSHDTRRFTFALQTPTTKLGLPIGQHISLRFTDQDGKNHQR